MARGNKAFKNNAEKRGGGQFVAIRMDVIRSEAWAKTSVWGTRLIMDLAAQYRGNNNGDLCAAWSNMKKRGWKSRDTLDRAKKDLLDKKWIQVTRQGARKIPTLYALTFWGVDECNGKLDPGICPRNKPRDTWKIGNTPLDIIKEQAKKKAWRIKNTDTVTGAMA